MKTLASKKKISDLSLRKKKHPTSEKNPPLRLSTGCFAMALRMEANIDDGMCWYLSMAF